MERIEADIYDRLSKVIDPELGRSITELGMIPAIEVTPAADGVYDVTVHVELTVEGCPLSDAITHRINAAVASYPDADLIPHIEVSTMDDDKLAELVNRLKAERRQNPFTKPDSKTRIFAIASGKGGRRQIVGHRQPGRHIRRARYVHGRHRRSTSTDSPCRRVRRTLAAEQSEFGVLTADVTSWHVKLLRYLPDDPGQRILDLGCGTGTLSAELEQAAEVLGVDSSPDMLARAAALHHAPTCGSRCVTPSTCRMRAVGRDLLTPGAHASAGDVHRALKPGGALICEFGAHGNIATVDGAFASDAGHDRDYWCKFTFPTVETADGLERHGLHVGIIRDYDRPTPLSPGYVRRG